MNCPNLSNFTLEWNFRKKIIISVLFRFELIAYKILNESNEQTPKQTKLAQFLTILAHSTPNRTFHKVNFINIFLKCLTFCKISNKYNEPAQRKIFGAEN